MTTSIQKLFIAIALLVAISSATSCKKDTFDEPPGNTADPNLDTISISRLKAYYTGGSPVSIPDDVNIAGIVIADDRTGSFYKSIVIDDGNAAIAVSIDVSSGLYTDYPIGRKIYVKCQGLALGTYGGTPQLGGYVDGTSVGRIAQALLPKVIVKGPTGNDIAPLVQHITIGQLNDSYLSRLVQFENVEFKGTSIDTPYAEVNKAVPDDGDRILGDCDGGTVTVRTSPFCTFAFARTPEGNGSILGVYTKYNSTKQLSIRDTSDVNLRGTNCIDIPPPVVDTILYENFNGVSTSGNLSIPSWTNFSTAGTKYWYGNGLSDKNARVSAFNSTVSQQQPSNICWLITPPVNLDASTNEKIVWRRYVGFVTGTIKMEVLYSTDYSGSGDPSSSTWNLLVDDAPAATTSFSNATPVSLNAITGTAVYFAFRYTGGYSPATNTTQYNLDNVLISH
jgi:hypothetical protein